MSNRLSIAAVTATLQDRLRSVAAAEVVGTEVLTARPGSKSQPEAGATIHVFLYDVLVNPFLRNDQLPPRREQLPTRDGLGNVVNEPYAALDLRYLLTFSGRDTRQEAQRLLGATIADFSLEPMLSPAEISRSTEAREHLQASNLHEQEERVIVTPLHLDLEELSRLWSVLLQQQPYELSLQYQVSAVMVSPEVELRPHPPVTEVRVGLEPSVAVRGSDDLGEIIAIPARERETP